MIASLTGAVASQRVTEVREGKLGVIRNHPLSAMAKAYLTEKKTFFSGI